MWKLRLKMINSPATQSSLTLRPSVLVYSLPKLKLQNYQAKGEEV